MFRSFQNDCGWRSNAVISSYTVIYGPKRNKHTVIFSVFTLFHLPLRTLFLLLSCCSGFCVQPMLVCVSLRRSPRGPKDSPYCTFQRQFYPEVIMRFSLNALICGLEAFAICHCVVCGCTLGVLLRMI